MVKEKILQPPENGLLVKELIPIAHEVYIARTELFACASRVVKSIGIYTCSLCGEVHVGHLPHKIRTCNVAGSPASKEHSWKPRDVEYVLPIVESFHLYDSLGRAVFHKEWLEVDRIPAVVELCIQAGIDIPKYPTRRRVFPAYNLAGVAVRGMEAWERMRSGLSKLIQKYAVQTCGYYPEVQVGLKGHRVRNCQAYKHQMRGGQHAWQEATIDDLVPPAYIWHVQNPKTNKPLINNLKRYYGMLPAVVELFALAGAKVNHDHYAGIMREDVAVPVLDEENLVV